MTHLMVTTNLSSDNAAREEAQSCFLLLGCTGRKAEQKKRGGFGPEEICPTTSSAWLEVVQLHQVLSPKMYPSRWRDGQTDGWRAQT